MYWVVPEEIADFTYRCLWLSFWMTCFNFHIIMQHLNNIFLNFHCKILKIDRVTVNLRRHLEKKLFCGLDQNSRQNHLKQKNQNAFVKGDVSQSYTGRISLKNDIFIILSTYSRPIWMKLSSNYVFVKTYLTDSANIIFRPYNG